jgi:hypothetical protein
MNITQEALSVHPAIDEHHPGSSKRPPSDR